MAARLLEEEIVPKGMDLTSTAVILADEKLLMPLIDSLPETVEDVNVTMGHPFRLTPLYSFLRQLMTMVRSARRSSGMVSFRSSDLIALLRHQYYRLLAGDDGTALIRKIISGNMIRVGAGILSGERSSGRLFEVPAEGAALPGYLTGVMEMLEEATFSAESEGVSYSTDREYLRMAITATVRISNLIGSHSLELGHDTCIRLLDRIFRRMIIPFSGEPLKGLQVMGVLETRALEFDNIIFLSLNEGIFPAISYDNSFIPYNIRRAFGLPTVNEQEAVFAYYFYRLLRRPTKGWFLYNSAAQGLNSGEMSRYLARMVYTPSFAPERETVWITVGRSAVMPGTIARREHHTDSLLSRYSGDREEGKYLSPSAVNTWLYCRMRFYFRYVCDMPEEEELGTEIDHRRFGNILHDAVKSIYEPLRGVTGAGSRLAGMAGRREEIRNLLISAAMREMQWDRETLLSGKGMIIIEVMERYLRVLLEYDGRITDLGLLGLEEEVKAEFPVATGRGETVIRLGGRADRIDTTGGVVRVVDYKTGTPRREKVTAEGLFDETRERQADALRQTLLYCTLIRPAYPDRVILPAIYWIQQIGSGQFSPYADVAGLNGTGAVRGEWQSFMAEFAAGLNLSLGKIFSDDEDFVMTPFRRRCDYCPYRGLCRR